MHGEQSWGTDGKANAERRGRHFDVRQGSGGGSDRSKSAGGSAYEKRRKSWKADGRVDDRPYRYKCYCLNDQAGPEDTSCYGEGYGCVGWVFRDRNIRYCGHCDKPLQYDWNAYDLGKQRLAAYKQDMGIG